MGGHREPVHCADFWGLHGCLSLFRVPVYCRLKGEARKKQFLGHPRLFGCLAICPDEFVESVLLCLQSTNPTDLNSIPCILSHILERDAGRSKVYLSLHVWMLIQPFRIAVFA